ncbi:Arm DNA-binding domain-containing protein [Burkholderia multivorans]|uniref:Arm DNA-binding domain-containing protein n=1 Tax=Burkholderia multivorans TaxID=87883 RepID=UPI0030B9DA82
MPIKPRQPLTETDIAAAPPHEKPYRLTDGDGLYLEITPSGGKYWRFKYRFAGKQKVLALGVYPNVTPAEARNQRDAARALLAAGVDPSEARKEERIAERTIQDRRKGAARFLLDNGGALSFRLGTRTLNLTAAETAELRAFLDATRSVTPKE